MTVKAVHEENMSWLTVTSLGESRKLLKSNEAKLRLQR